NLFTVHRLDRETSGLIVFAKSKDVSQFLFNEFKSKFVKKTYFAIVHGIPNSFGFFSSPLVETSFGNIRDSVLPVSVGKLTKTEYELVSSSFDKKFSLLKLNPISGKKHQIRVHLSTAGFPIVGDKQYGFYPEKLNDYFLGVLSSQEILDLWLAPRHLLHCSSLSFKHPKSLKTVCFQSKITSDLVYFLNRAKFDL
ncbi:RNA pseudouridine synthase, partial [Candidatus Woesearchaeota archaeon]|nr:RNA pseudouridine synthase [Candidatus Woesearchaeota archaeon]